MSAEVIDLATAFRPLKGSAWPLADEDPVAEIEVRCSNFRVRRLTHHAKARIAAGWMLKAGLDVA